jgi:hypothetical protein
LLCAAFFLLFKKSIGGTTAMDHIQDRSSWCKNSSLFITPSWFAESGNQIHYPSLL